MKKPNWQKTFWTIINENRTRPFMWGSHDCVTLAIKVITGISDHIPDLQVIWTTEEEAAQFMAVHGGLQAIVDSYLGASTNWGNCGMGDLVLTEMPNGNALAVHDGAQLIAPSPHGLRRIPFEFARVGWRL